MLLKHSLKLKSESEAIESAVKLALEDGSRTADIKGSGQGKVLNTVEMTDKIIEHLRVILRRKNRPMTLAEKILCDKAIGLNKPEVEPGQMICVKVDWTISSEVSYSLFLFFSLFFLFFFLSFFLFFRLTI